MVGEGSLSGGGGPHGGWVRVLLGGGFMFMIQSFSFMNPARRVKGALRKGRPAVDVGVLVLHKATFVWVCGLVWFGFGFITASSVLCFSFVTLNFGSWFGHGFVTVCSVFGFVTV